MSTTTITLDKHWEKFIQDKVDSGQYHTANDVIQDSLRLLEERERMIEALRREIKKGKESGSAGYVDKEEIKRLGRQQAGINEQALKKGNDYVHI